MTGPVPRPAGVSTPATAPYWAAAAEGRLQIQECRQCGHVQHYPRTLCSTCWSEDLQLVDAAGTGTVFTYTVVRQPGHPAWRGQVPYVLALIELDEGPRVMSNIVGVPVDQITVGAPVHLTPAPTTDGGPPTVVFTLTDTATATPATPPESRV